MAQADSFPAASGQSKALPRSVDLLIVGAGIMGLWAAVKAERLGLSALLVEQKQPAAGASGGVLGALMAHMPDQWNDKKQFQLDSLVLLETEIALLEAQTGLSAAYRRCGRLIPLPKAHLRPLAEARQIAAEENWKVGSRRFAWQVAERSADPRWLSDAACASGVIVDQLAARISPRALTAALVAAVDAGRQVRRLDGVGLRRLMPRKAETADGQVIAFGHAIIAAGVSSFDLLAQLGPAPTRPLGMAVKGQAACLKAEVDPALPLIFLNGLYLVAHEDGQVAIGSTSEDRFDAPFATDGQLDALIKRARALSPALEDAPVTERWAGLRPKAIDREPMIGPHPDAPQVHALTGGFKVSFGLAHRLADAVLAQIVGEVLPVPDAFLLSHHLKVAMRPN
ncbi:FAD-binding oxidoreductase [Rhizobium sp. SSA_523]|uniref:NAD(P)/FAD-dependent oxidoreductase n=1 Tax=Rhizobium sp. SSA_523 TaxID=2952477 RepID=UPI002090A81F|nr:FAD-binding oxidoreductase [Rhizobium sp. SSA_523]MCO5730544.1 FAD-binding oxidoreductase [Rhizobium sp. SSA_523]WKC25686.1 FAD-binding oxidoreductase [Rhizobium sp. SSA_523]